MKTKAITTIMLTLFLASIAFTVTPALATPTVLHVDDDGAQWPGAYTTISAAVSAASSGYTIIVHEGTYTEQVDVDKDVTITAAVGEERPVVNADPKAFVITADDATVEGFKVYQKLTAFGTGNDVIMVYDADRVTVRDNIVKGAGPYTTWQDRNPGPGITVLISDDVTVEGNRIYDTSGAGIWFGSSSNSLIEDNTIVNSQYTGILLPDWSGQGPSHGNDIVGNEVRDVGSGLVSDDGIRLGAGAHDNVVQDNEVEAANRDGICVVGSAHDNEIQGNEVEGSVRHGILIEGDGNEIQGNEVKDNGRAGIRVEGDGNEIQGNEVKDNGRVGILVRGDGNEIHHNEAKQSGWDGIRVVGDSNDVYDNEANDNGQYGFRVRGDYNDIHGNEAEGNSSGPYSDEGSYNDDWDNSWNE